VCAVVYIGFITFATIPEQNVRFADTILGFLLGTIVATFMNFFYGTSKSSQDKTDKMAEMAKEMR
jgi:multisubunit Na+/H+ antiporter MnhE subunit